MLPVLSGARTTTKGSATGLGYWASYYVTSTHDSTLLMVLIRIQKRLILYRRFGWPPICKSQYRTFGFWSKAMYPWWILILIFRNCIWLISELYQILDTPLWPPPSYPPPSYLLPELQIINWMLSDPSKQKVEYPGITPSTSGSGICEIRVKQGKTMEGSGRHK